MGKGESILTFRDWNTTQPILIEGLTPCLFVSFFLKNFCGLVLIELLLSKSQRLGGEGEVKNNN